MKRSPRPRKTAELSKSLQQQLNMYALAAGAAGVGLLALAQPAEGKIVYTPADIQVTGKPIPIDFNHDGIVDLFLFHLLTGGRFTSYLLACPNTLGGTTCGSPTYALNAFRVVESHGHRWAAAVKGGARVVGGDQFQSRTNAVLGSVRATSQRGTWRGPWMNGGKGVKDRYVGVKFQINGRFHFGWTRLTLTTTKYFQFTATVTGYAYETIPGKGIIAGKTRGPDEAITRQSASLGHLAAGASAIPAWRSGK